MSYLDKLMDRRDAVKVEMDAILEAVAAENRIHFYLNCITAIHQLV